MNEEQARFFAAACNGKWWAWSSALGTELGERAMYAMMREAGMALLYRLFAIGDPFWTTERQHEESIDSIAARPVPDSV